MKKTLFIEEDFVNFFALMFQLHHPHRLLYFKSKYYLL